MKNTVNTPNILITDFDGTIADTTATAVTGIKRVLQLIGENDNASNVSSFADYWRFFGKYSELKNIEPDQTIVLRELHRKYMDAHANTTNLFDDVMNIYWELERKPIIVSSAYFKTIVTGLGDSSDCFHKIYGLDTAPKQELLKKMKERYNYIYVTDTRIDITRCKNVGVPVIAVTWGFDSKEVLQNASPDFYVDTTSELRKILCELKLMK
ncbi:MAG: HAD family hydrolase [Bacteroidetes bacterium]|nr:HAD family hydrolase [Bacteroidota bacterium]